MRIGGGELRNQRPVGMRPQRQLTSFDNLAKDRFIVEQRPSHSEPLRALPGKNESQFFAAGESFATGRQPCASLSFQESIETVDKLFRRIAGHTQAIVVMTATRARVVA